MDSLKNNHKYVAKIILDFSKCYKRRWYKKIKITDVIARPVCIFSSFIFDKICFNSDCKRNKISDNYWMDVSNRGDLTGNLKFVSNVYTLKKINFPKINNISFHKSIDRQISIINIYMSMLKINKKPLELNSLIYLHKTYFQYILLKQCIGIESRIITYLTYSIPGLLLLKFLDARYRINITCVQHGYKTGVHDDGSLRPPLVAGCDEIILFDENAVDFYKRAFARKNICVPSFFISKINYTKHVYKFSCINNVVFIPTFSEKYNPYDEIITFCKAVIRSGCVPYVKPHPRILSSFHRRLYTYFKLRKFKAYIKDDIDSVNQETSIYVSNGSTLLYHMFNRGRKVAFYSNCNHNDLYLFKHTSLNNSEELFRYLAHEKCD